MNQVVDGYELTELTDVITMRHLISVHYFEYSKNYIFEGERHNFWEILYVDKGEIDVIVEGASYGLCQGEMLLHQPNQWHALKGNGVIAPNLVVIAFDCRDAAMAYFEDKVMTADGKVKAHLGTIISEAKKAFVTDLSDPTTKVLHKRKAIEVGAEQLIRLHLELMFLEMLRDKDLYSTAKRNPTAIKAYVLEEKLAIIIRFLEEHLYQRLTLEDICRQTLLSKSSLIKIFKEGMGISIMEYFKRRKIEAAKTLIREGNHNFTQIAEIIGYSSIHYFSRIFKSVTGMTLTEYATSVKIYTDQDQSMS